MNFELPRPSLITVIIQCLIMLACALATYLAVSSITSTRGYDNALLTLQKKERRLNHTLQRLNNYDAFIAESPHFTTLSVGPQWEKVDENWLDLTFETLMQRISGLYREDRPFVLESFSASLEKKTGKQKGGTNKRSEEQGTEEESRKLVFELRGYFLCPCQ